MAVRADHVALGCLSEDLLPALESGSAGAQIERLRPRVAMIEVHLVALETAATIGAGHTPKLP